MDRYQKTYQEMVSLLTDFQAIDPRMFGYNMSFNSKAFSFEMMYRETLKRIRELEEIYKKESTQGKKVLEETGVAWSKSVAYFEAYLNAFYSLLQIIAKITLLFYKEPKMSSITKEWGDNFGKLIDFFKRNKSIDSQFSVYVDKNLGWYETLRNNRHMITHEGSAFLGFSKGGKILFLDYPKKGFNWFDPNKSTKDLESYLSQSFENLFSFLDFYATHFRQQAKT